MDTFVCKNVEDEYLRVPDEPQPVDDLREAVLGLWTVVQFAKTMLPGRKNLENLNFFAKYSREVWSRKKRTPMDVPRVVDEWKSIVVILCTAHEKAAIDAAEFKLDELLTPLLTAPVKQLREFYNGLTVALRDDPAVPFFVWTMFNAWGKGIIDRCEDREEAKVLRKDLAQRIAEMVEEDVKPDIVSALVGALMWRDPKDLEKMESEIKSGAKPRVRGRESCLFLTTEKDGQELTTVML